jgi:hypothetical protein
MEVDPQELAKHNADYAAVTGLPLRHFVCPVTLRDDPTVVLCNGHILNHAIAKACRKTVIQYKHVDGHFSTIENELVQFLNTPVAATQALMRAGGDVTATLPSGEKAELFFPGRKAAKNAERKFQRIDLLGADGHRIDAPFLRGARLEPGVHRGLRVEFDLKFQDSALLGALLKSCYLALFRMLGYRHVFSLAGDKVRRALAAFCEDRAPKHRALDYFNHFTGAFNYVQNVQGRHPNTLDTNDLWLHEVEGGPEDGLLFAQSCLFLVNSRLITVTVPAVIDEKDYLVAHWHYERFLNDRGMPQRVRSARYNGTGFEVGEPRAVRYMARPRLSPDGHTTRAPRSDGG